VRSAGAVGIVLLACFFSPLFLSSARVREGLSQEVSPAPVDRPNMVFVLADDLAEEDLNSESG
jgi:hypothetical protein